MRDEDRDRPVADAPGASSADGPAQDADREVMGILEVFSNTPEAFPESAQKLLQSFAEECARIRVVATELSWHKPAAGAGSDDFMPPPLPYSGYMWPDFAVAEPANYDVAAFLGPESMGPELASDESASDEENTLEAVAATKASDIHTPAARERSQDAPAFIHYLTPRRSYEAWSLGLGGVALIAIVAVSFLIGSRVGWLRRSSSQLMTSAATAATPSGATDDSTDSCVGTTGPGCPAGGGAASPKSRRGGSPAKATERSNKTVESGKTTLLTSMYESFQDAPFGGYEFAGSATLPGFEQRCHEGRIESEGLGAHTLRTPAAVGASFLHLRLRTEDESREFSDLLLSDISGELFDRAKDSTDECKALSFLRRADRLVLLLDGARLANPGFGQGLVFHSCRFNPGTLEKCFRLFVTSVERSEIACDAISKSILPIGVPACSRVQRSRA